MFTRLLIALLVAASTSAAMAADAVYKANVASVGASGFRYRAVGETSWTTAPIVAGVAEFEWVEGGEIEAEWIGIPYGVTTIDLDEYPLDTGAVAFDLGAIVYGPAGVSRDMTITSAAGSQSVQQAFMRGVGAAFPVEDLSAALAGEFMPRLAVLVGLCVGGLIALELVRAALSWSTVALAVDDAPKEWRTHRRRGEELLRSKQNTEARERAYDDVLGDRREDLAIGDDDYNYKSFDY